MCTKDSTSCLTTLPHVDILKPVDAMRYIEKITHDSNLFTFLRDMIDLKHEFTHGLVKEELNEIIDETEEPAQRILLQKVLELEENQTTLLAATLIRDQHIRHTWVVKGTNRNGKFDLVNIHAIQKKEIDKKKLLAYGLTCLTLGNMSEQSENAAHGFNALTTLFSSTKEEPVDVFYSYIMKDLYDKGLLNTLNEKTDTWA